MTDKEDVQPTRQSKTPIFSEIRLRNFKSITQATIPLHGLTVIVGANSAGKSTMLQALLVLAQAARSEVSSGRLQLNGEYVLLGEFQEVQTFTAQADQGIMIGLSAAVTPSEPRIPAAVSRSREGLGKLSWDGHFSEPQNPYSGYADLRSVELALSDQSGNLLTAVDISSVSEDFEDSEMSRIEDPFRFLRGPRLRVEGRLSSFKSHTTDQIQRARLYGGIPGELFLATTFNTLFSRIWWDIWSRNSQYEWTSLRDQHRRGVGPFESPLDSERRFAAVTRASELVRNSKEINSLSAIDGGFDGDLRRILVRLLRDDLVTCSEKERSAVLISMTELREKGFTDELRNRLNDVLWLNNELNVDIRSQNDDFESDLGTYFRAGLRSLKYLGPIREAPRVTYDPSPNRNDLGVRGEYAAAVLNAQYLHQVKCPLPEGGVARMPLGEALDIWLSEFGLASHAKSRDLGRRGMSLSVVPREGAREVDLTSVGVGVSQVMPVILLCLLSRPSSVVILEQPELHLHPAMQLKLADFFLACRRMGLQIILETHSEHLVNRLRRRVAEDDSDNLRHEIGLLFAEQEDGVSRYRSTSINEYGALSGDWPAGFLDVGTDEAGEFLQGALRRRSRVTDKQVDDDI